MDGEDLDAPLVHMQAAEMQLMAPSDVQNDFNRMLNKLVHHPPPTSPHFSIPYPTLPWHAREQVAVFRERPQQVPGIQVKTTGCTGWEN